MANGDVALQLADHLVRIEIAGNVPHGAMRVEILAIEGGDPCRFLAAMLQRVQAERHQRRSAIGAIDAKDPAFLMQMVVLPRIGGEHLVRHGKGSLVSAALERHIGTRTGFVAPQTDAELSHEQRT